MCRKSRCLVPVIWISEPSPYFDPAACEFARCFTVFGDYDQPRDRPEEKKESVSAVLWGSCLTRLLYLTTLCCLISHFSITSTRLPLLVLHDIRRRLWSRDVTPNATSQAVHSFSASDSSVSL